MDSFKFHNRWNSIHQIIKQEKTGALREFSKRVGIGKTQLNMELNEMKLQGAPIEYCKIRKTYYYTHEVEFFFGFKALKNNDLNKIMSGNRYLLKNIFACPFGADKLDVILYRKTMLAE